MSVKSVYLFFDYGKSGWVKEIIVILFMKLDSEEKYFFIIFFKKE